jgi:hypothetical protein
LPDCSTGERALRPDETGLKQCRNPIVLNSLAPGLDQRSEKEITMIQVGSKEEVAFLLALFGTHTQPVPRPKPKSQQG